MSTDFIQTIFEQDNSNEPIYMVYIKLTDGNAKIIRIQGTEEHIYEFFRPQRNISINKEEKVVKYINIIGEVKRIKSNEEETYRIQRRNREESKKTSHRGKSDIDQVHHQNIN